MSKKVLKTLTQKPEKKFITITVRLTPDEHEALKKKAGKWADGNVTALVKYSSLNFEPKEADLAAAPK